MAETLLADAFEVTASEGRVLIEAPGFAATLDVDAAAILSDQLLAACSAARLQQHAAINQR